MSSTIGERKINLSDVDSDMVAIRYCNKKKREPLADLAYKILSEDLSVSGVSDQDFADKVFEVLKNPSNDKVTELFTQIGRHQFTDEEREIITDKLIEFASSTDLIKTTTGPKKTDYKAHQQEQANKTKLADEALKAEFGQSLKTLSASVFQTVALIPAFVLKGVNLLGDALRFTANVCMAGFRIAARAIGGTGYYAGSGARQITKFNEKVDNWGRYDTFKTNRHMKHALAKEEAYQAKVSAEANTEEEVATTSRRRRQNQAELSAEESTASLEPQTVTARHGAGLHTIDHPMGYQSLLDGDEDEVSSVVSSSDSVRGTYVPPAFDARRNSVN